MDSFDPVADNAEMPGDMEGGTAVVLTHLGVIGNTKGIAIATAALAAAALFGSFGTSAESALT